MRTIVIGDVHGCLAELKQLLSVVEHTPDDRVICAGDIVDRGPYPVQTVRFVRAAGFGMVLGNHEEKHVRWARHEQRRLANPKYRNPMRPFEGRRMAEHDALTDDERHWLAELPPFLRFEHEGRPWLITHGGVPSDMPVEKQEPKRLIRCRHVDEVTGAYASKDDPFEVPAGSVYWTRRWRGPESVVYGHIVHQDFMVRWDRPEEGVHCIGIDTGCCFGGSLTAAVFVPGDGLPRIQSVPAKEPYAVHRTLRFSP
jgi:bis(5'-nucleosyl)-tetraphosphatase (symmetrical)